MIDTPDESLYRTMRKEGKKSIHRERILAYSTVGTPDYIAPEVLSQKVGVYFDRACTLVYLRVRTGAATPPTCISLF
jgi:serine/threonine protein kinase